MHGYNSVREKLGYNDNQDNQLQDQQSIGDQSHITHVSAVTNERSSMQQQNPTNNRQ
jgi:hypothetical protein